MQSKCAEVGTANNYETSRFIELYRRFARIPIPINASIYKKDDGYNLQVKYSQRDLDLMEKTSFKKYYTVFANEFGIENISCVSDACDATTELVVKYSDSLKKKVILRKNPKENQKVKSMIEVWEEDTKIKTLTSDVLEKSHGDIIAAPEFGSFQWSPNEKSFLYVVEHKGAQSESFFKETSVSTESDKPILKGTEFEYREEWGESFDGIHHTCVCVVDVENNFKIRCIEIENMSLGQAFWIDENIIGFVAFQEEPYRLGLVYCHNRQNLLYAYDLIESKPEILYGNDADVCIRCPRLSPNGKKIVFLNNSAFGPHDKASKLMLYNRETKVVETVIDIKSNDADFTPLYLPDGLPSNCFTTDGKHILFSSLMKCQNVICCVDLENKILKKFNSSAVNAEVLDVKYNILVTVNDSPKKLPSVYLAKINFDVDSLEFKEIDSAFGEQIVDIDFKIEEHVIEENGLKSPLSTILIGPSSKMGSSTAAVIIPHGGPHSSFAGFYIMRCALFAKIGLKSLLVNYRGSTGVNEEYLNSLCGNVGSMDVNDVMFCINKQIDKGEIDRKNIVLYSGSHGGFLITHLCGQFPDFGFKACVARNPVVDLSGMIEVTDIPDWNFIEGLGSDEPYKFGNFGSSEVLKTCFEKSPMNYVQKVKTPTFLMLGRNDKRVPITQGIKYFKALKSRGVDVKCHIYDDKHDLNKVHVDADAFVNTVSWLFNYIDK